ncbi:MAG TPA: ribosomal protein L7/L12 [Allocoleopsis sp.]
MPGSTPVHAAFLTCALANTSSKDFVESAPKVVKAALAIADAQDIKQQLESVGATVSLK